MTNPHDEGPDFGYAELGRIRLHYAKSGSGKELVLLLHGFPEFWYSWRHQLADLADEYTVVAPDMRGYNLSEKPPDVASYKIDELIEDIAALIKYFGHEQAAIVGHDWGAGVAWAIAQKKPEILSKLACLQVPPPSVWRKNQTFRQFAASWYMFFFQIPFLPEMLLKSGDFAKLANGLKTTTAREGVFTNEDIEKYREAWARSGALTGGLNYYRANIMKRMFGKAPVPKKIEVPTLFIYGEQDRAVLPQTVEGVGDMVGAEFTELRIPEAAHWVQLEAREKVTTALKEFLTK
ncbi:MAG: alpha/beta hydrolase [Acidobacteriota bacterium]|nr:alpha/beta hydrolase [Acidobacteriota bacterium]MDH3531190.1 alpha/beta hydrolase [Acidobacteriota bacterium]